MGKFPNSSIHDWFSDWHLNPRVKRSAYLADVDRLWIEIRERKPVAALDLKWGDSSDGETWTEEITSEWFERHGIPYYLVQVETEPELKFRISRQVEDEEVYLTEKEMIDWINSDFDPELVFQHIKEDE